jgi:hypothetical protein
MFIRCNLGNSSLATTPIATNFGAASVYTLENAISSDVSATGIAVGKFHVGSRADIVHISTAGTQLYTYGEVPIVYAAPALRPQAGRCRRPFA